MAPEAFRTQRIRSWLLWWAVLLTGGLLSTLTHGLVTNDESWFLQVVHRLVNGEVLYRDIFFGVTPLSAYLAYLPVKVLGTHILILKVILSVCFATSGLLAIVVGDQLDLDKPFPFLLGLSMLALSSPWLTGTAAPYTPLAMLFLMSCLSLALAWSRCERQDPASNLYLVLAGAAAGAAFAAKQTTGALALAALVIAVVAIESIRRASARIIVREILLATVVWLAVVGLILLPTVADSSRRGPFVDYVFLNKKTYLDVAGIAYVTEATRAVQDFVQVRSVESARWLIWQSSLILPPVAVACWLAGMTNRAERKMVGALLGIFSLAAFVEMFPRVTAHHASTLLPLMLVVIAWGWRAAGLEESRMSRPLAFGLAVSLTLAGTCSLLIPAGLALRGDYQASRLPHFEGILVRSDFNALVPATRQLRDRTSGQPLFFLTPSAGLFYLVSGLRNPTPYDYPQVTAFGLHGEERTVAGLVRGRIRFVCYTALPVDDPLRPHRLAGFVETQMERLSDSGACQLYKTR